MAAVFSIRHYLIDRVAGLIVRGGYFRAAFVWISAILPPLPLVEPNLPTPPLPPLHHHTPSSSIQGSVISSVYVHGQRAGLLCCWLFASHQQRAKFGQWHKKMEGLGNGDDGQQLAKIYWTHPGWSLIFWLHGWGTFVSRHFVAAATLQRLWKEYYTVYRRSSFTNYFSFFLSHHQTSNKDNLSKHRKLFEEHDFILFKKRKIAKPT